LVWYVGSTCNPYQRQIAHRGKYAKGVGADLIPEEYEWEMIVKEVCPEDQRDERERYYIQTLMPLLNKALPKRTIQDSRDAWMRYKQRNLERVREEAKLRARKYRERKKMG
jgi:hypothetical protein